MYASIEIDDQFFLSQKTYGKSSWINENSIGLIESVIGETEKKNWFDHSELIYLFFKIDLTWFFFCS